MSKVISIVNQKGGVGKTTTSMNLSAALAEKGQFVLMVDLDPQGNATSGLGLDTEQVEAGLYEALANEHQLKDIVFNNQDHEGLRIAPATEDLAGANVEFVELDRREFQLSDLLEEARHAYDYIIIDCPPSLGLLTINGLVAADEVIIPVQAEYYALEGLGQLLNSINLVREHIKPELDILGAFLTMLDKRTNLSGEVKEELHNHFPDKVFDAEIPRSVRLAEAPSYGQSIFEYEPSSRGAKAYKQLAEEILGKHNN
ncbi:MAG: ParA family protein [Candidatus Paceibacteria bacterium]